MQGFVAHDGGVIFGIGAGDHGLGQIGQIDGPAGLFEGVVALELLGGGDEVDGRAFAVQVQEGPEDGGMGRQIEVRVRDEVHDDVHELGPHEDAAQHCLFGFGAVGRHAPQQVVLRGAGAVVALAGAGRAGLAGGRGRGGAERFVAGHDDLAGSG